MTSYSQKDYYYINENDALSCNSRPISSTIHRPSSNNYDIHTDMCDRCGNTGVDGMNHMDVATSCFTQPQYDFGDEGINDMIAQATTTGIGGVSSSAYVPLRANDIPAYTRNDNIMYHNKDVYKVCGIYGTTDDPYEGVTTTNYRAVCELSTATFSDCGHGNNVAISNIIVGDGRHTNYKMLPELPINHSRSIMDGVYNCNSQSASLPTPPSAVGQQTKHRMLPQTAAGAYRSSSGGNDGMGYSAYSNLLNGHSIEHATTCDNETAVTGEYFPTAPLRALPQQKSRSTIKRQLFEDAVTMSASSITTTTTASIFYDNSTTSNYNNYYSSSGGGVGGSSSMYSSPTHTSTTFDAFYPMQQRPHTSMVPIDYRDDYPCYAYESSTENLSTYSDTPAITTTQQKLQQQQRKHSIIMSMTAASVIASGETRITPQQKQHQLKAGTATTAPSTTAMHNTIGGMGSYSFEYDSSGVAAPKSSIASGKNDLFSITSSKAMDDYYIAACRKVATKTATSQEIVPREKPETSIIALSSVVSSSSSTITDSLPSVITISTMSTRKLPKRLPTTPKYNNKNATPNGSINNKSNNHNIITSTFTKQLPKLPKQKMDITAESTTINAAITSSYINSSQPLSIPISSLLSSSSSSSISTTIPTSLSSRSAATLLSSIYATTNTSLVTDGLVKSPKDVELLALPAPGISANAVATSTTTSASCVNPSTLPITSLRSFTAFTAPTTTLSFANEAITSLINYDITSKPVIDNNKSILYNNNDFSNNNNINNNNNNNINSNKSGNNNKMITNDNNNSLDAKTTAAITKPSYDSSSLAPTFNIFNQLPLSSLPPPVTPPEDILTTTTFDITDYLKPYTLPAYISGSNLESTNGISSTYSLPTSYNLFHSRIAVGDSTTTATASVESRRTTASSKAIFSPPFNATTYTSMLISSSDTKSDYSKSILENSTAPNFTISTNKLTNSSISAQLKSSNSYSISTTTVPVPSSTSTSLTIRNSSKSSSNLSPIIDKDGIASTIGTIATIAETDAATKCTTTIFSPMPTYFSSLEDYDCKSNDLYSATSTGMENFPLSITTTTMAASTSNIVTQNTTMGETMPSVQFTTTIAAVSCNDVTTNITSSITDTTSYADYLKQFDLVNALANIETITTNSTTNKSDSIKSELPIYITDFLHTDFTNKYSPLLEYKIGDYSINDGGDNVECSTGIGSAPAAIETSLSTAADDYMTYVNKYTPISIDITSAKTTTSDSIIITSTHSECDNKLSTFSLDYENVLPTATTTVSSVILADANSLFDAATDSKSIKIAFDDSFYDSYNVDLSTLTGTVDSTLPSESVITTYGEIKTTGASATTIESSYLNSADMHSTNYATPIATSDPFSLQYTSSLFTEQQQHQKQNLDAVFSTTSSGSSTSIGSDGTQRGYYKPISTTTSAAQKTSSISTISAADKASSMLNGFSKGIKGGLDGVLSGVSVVTAATNSTQQQPPAQSANKKSSFGFGLASKLVPNVGGLLAGATTLTNKQAQAATIKLDTSSIAMPILSKLNVSTTTIQANKQPSTSNEFDFIQTTSISLLDFSSTTTTATPTPTNEYNNANVIYTMQLNNGMMMKNAHSSNGLLYTTDTSQSELYNVSSSNRAHYGNQIHYGSGDDDVYMTAHQQKQQMPVMVSNDDLQPEKIGMDITNDNGNKYVDDEYSYSEFDEYEKMGGDMSNLSYEEHIALQSDNNAIALVTTASDELVAETRGGVSLYQQQQQPPLKTGGIAPTVTTTSVGKSLGQKATSSLLSSFTNAASPTPTPAKTAISSGGGMFGSIFGKAAAAVQSATQVVNQGASMATAAVAQKVPTAVAKPTATTDQSKIPYTTIASNTVFNQAMGAVGRGGYELILNNDFNNQLLANQDPLSSQYSITGDDYENSNMLVYATTSPMETPPSMTINRNVNYYSNGNQSQQATKLLPMVPPAGSTGKKLPTINGKSGFLIKQQPTEIFDDEDDDEDIINVELIGNKPNYRIDSEQDDYYMDHQQTKPSSRSAANIYYEHTNGGYDYREDYFNEEDEYKYLEKEEQQKTQEEMLYQQQHPKLLLQKILHQKQSSLDYIDDGNDNYADDNYPSEDSGNYLDESSSGSIGVVGSKLQNELVPEGISGTAPIILATTSLTGIISSATAARTSVLAAMQSEIPITIAHQQIKKQDSIIMEEDEDELSVFNNIVSPVHGGNINASLSRKSSILDDEYDDEITELPPSHHTQKKTMVTCGETEEVVGGYMLVIRKSEVTAKQRWHWAYNKTIMQLNNRFAWEEF